MKKRLYMIVESTIRKQEIYYMVMTETEIRSWCKSKNEMYGGKRCDGGDPSYSCWACWATPNCIR